MGKKRLKVQLKRLQDDNEEEFDFDEESSLVNEEFNEMQHSFSMIATSENNFTHTTAIHNAKGKDLSIKTHKAIAKKYSFDAIEDSQFRSQSGATDYDNSSHSSASSDKEKSRSNAAGGSKFKNLV